MELIDDIKAAFKYHEKGGEEGTNKALGKPTTRSAPTVTNAPKAVKNAAGYKKYQEATMLEGGTPKSMEEWAAE